MDVSRNALTGTLPQSLSSLSLVGLSVFDNNLAGTIPPSYSSMSYLAASYNPALTGAWPSASKPYQWSFKGGSPGPSSYTTTFSINSLLPSGGPIGPAGGSNGVGVANGTAGCTFGTSLGFNQPVYSVLQAAAAVLDPGGALGPGWHTGLQPCPPWSFYRGGVWYNQSVSSVAYGGSWTGVTCQDWCSTSSYSGVIGGVSAIAPVGLGLNGSVPSVLSNLTTLGTSYTGLTFLDLSRNALTGTLPPSLSALSNTLNAASSGLQLSVFDNNLTGTIPASYTSLYALAVSYNPALYGSWPGSVPKQFSYAGGPAVASSYTSTYLGGGGALASGGPFGTTGGSNGVGVTNGTAGCTFGTSLRLDQPLYSILQSAAAALDPSGSLLPTWVSGSLQPCPPWSFKVNGVWYNQSQSAVAYGGNWPGVTCWDSCSSSSSAAGGASYIALNALQLNGTLPSVFSSARTLTSLDLSSNRLTGSIPASWCVCSGAPSRCSRSVCSPCAV